MKRAMIAVPLIRKSARLANRTPKPRSSRQYTVSLRDPSIAVGSVCVETVGIYGNGPVPDKFWECVRRAACRGVSRDPKANYFDLTTGLFADIPSQEPDIARNMFTGQITIDLTGDDQPMPDVDHNDGGDVDDVSSLSSGGVEDDDDDDDDDLGTILPRDGNDLVVHDIEKLV